MLRFPQVKFLKNTIQKIKLLMPPPSDKNHLKNGISDNLYRKVSSSCPTRSLWLIFITAICINEAHRRIIDSITSSGLPSQGKRVGVGFSSKLFSDSYRNGFRFTYHVALTAQVRSYLFLLQARRVRQV